MSGPGAIRGGRDAGTGAADGEPETQGGVHAVADDYLAQVMAEIDEEVRRRRGEIPVRMEQELDALFLEYSPVAGRGGDLGDVLRMVDAAAFIDPVVPVESKKSGGAFVKKSLRSLNLWYIGYVTHQVSQFAATVGRALRLVDDQLAEMRRQLPVAPTAPVLDSGGPDAWWLPVVTDALASAHGRVLHAACGDGWLVRALVAAGCDAYGVDPRPGVVDDAELAGTDLRQERPDEHLRAVDPSALGGIVVSGVVDGMAGPQRDELLALVAERLAADGVLAVHSMSPAAWAAEDAPPDVDLAPGHPLRPATWRRVLEGWSVELHEGPGGADYLVIARK